MIFLETTSLQGKSYSRQASWAGNSESQRSGIFVPLIVSIFKSLLEKCEADIKTIQEGTNKDFIRDLASLEHEQSQRNRSHKLFHDYQLSCLNNVFEVETEGIRIKYEVTTYSPTKRKSFQI